MIALFELLCEDDWALSDLGRVSGMIGEPSIELLGAYLKDNGHSEFARVMALDGLAEVAKQCPECRDRVVQNIKDYMVRPDTSAPALNGLLLGQLIDLEAVELIDDIRRLFEKQCVDIGCAGDLEDVEIALGIRGVRSTPKPNYGVLNRIPPRPAENSDDLYAMIDYDLGRYGNDDSLLDAAELDGFIAVITCSPEMIPPSRWMPAIWGGDRQSPDWADINEARAFTQIVTVFYNQVTATLQNDEFEALFHEREVAGRTYYIVDDWCEGFLRGVHLWNPLSPSDSEVLEKCLSPIRLFTTHHENGALEAMTDDEVADKQAKIEPSVRRLYGYFREQLKPMNPVIRGVPKVGRNDSCPCGSGKKYKRCCLQ
ncbi:MAG: UPF0149 family protein [Gammaproteobacteria bacterium]|nr:UPF0149 family protein [Gammaproteobacteria bacterium]